MKLQVTTKNYQVDYGQTKGRQSRRLSSPCMYTLKPNINTTNKTSASKRARQHKAFLGVLQGVSKTCCRNVDTGAVAGSMHLVRSLVPRRDSYAPKRSRNHDARLPMLAVVPAVKLAAGSVLLTSECHVLRCGPNFSYTTFDEQMTHLEIC